MRQRRPRAGAGIGSVPSDTLAGQQCTSHMTLTTEGVDCGSVLVEQPGLSRRPRDCTICDLVTLVTLVITRVPYRWPGKECRCLVPCSFSWTGHAGSGCWGG